MSRWLPIESNPDVMNKFVHSVGLEPSYSFCDVFGLDADLLAMVPRPVAAVLLLFPCTENQDAARKAEQAELAKSGFAPNPKAFFLKQTIGNACGTIGLIHAVANNLDSLTLGEGFLRTYIDECKALSPEERGHKLEHNEGITAVHEGAAHEGQTQAPSLDDSVNLHFICFTAVEGRLYEFDGTKPAPVDHGPTSADTLLEDSVVVVQKFMSRDPDNVNFTVVALARTQE
eukprot:m.12709 g.12709  ORF g.12709 m.12709 type:complete len:230 (+) comp2750_c0_seq1:147-836(+)